MRKFVLALLLLIVFPFFSQAQSRAMKNLSEKHEEAFTLMFYYSTLKMLIPEDNVEFHDIIYNIEKIKLLRLNNPDERKNDFLAIQSDLESEGFEQAMFARHQGNDMFVFVKDKKGITTGAFFLMESDTTLTALDLVGEIPINKLFTLSNEIDMLTGIKNITDF